MKEVRCASIPGRRNLACAPIARRICGFSSSFRVARPDAPHTSPESTRTAAGKAAAGATMGAGGCSAERRRIVYSANTYRQRACCCRRACSRMLYSALVLLSAVASTASCQLIAVSDAFKLAAAFAACMPAELAPQRCAEHSACQSSPLLTPMGSLFSCRKT